MVNFNENIETFEKIILMYLVYSDDDYVIRDEQNNEVDKQHLIQLLQPSFFTIPIHGDIFKHIKDFDKSYSKLPNVDELSKILELKNVMISKEEFNSIFTINIHKYTPEFLYKYFRSFILVKTLNSQINKVSIKLKSTTPSPDTIDEIFDYVRTALNEDIDIEISNTNEGLDIYNPKSHIQALKNTKSTGFPYLDIVLGGGWEPKTFVVFQGRPKIGKSLVLSNLAVRAANLGNNVGVFTVELGDSKYMKRLGSNLFSVPYTKYKQFVDENSLDELTLAIERYKTTNPNAGVLNVKEFPTGSASVVDIENYFLKLEKKNKMHFDVIFVDYVNLLKPLEADGTMYEKIKKICEGLRKIAMRNKWCVVSATQIKSQYFSSDDLGLDSGAESSGLVATVDSLFGLTGEPDDPCLKIKNIANRDEGYMNSYAMYRKVKDFYRLIEDGDDYMNLGMDANATFNEYYKDHVLPTITPIAQAPTVVSSPTFNDTIQPNIDFENEKNPELVTPLNIMQYPSQIINISKPEEPENNTTISDIVDINNYKNNTQMVEQQPKAEISQSFTNVMYPSKLNLNVENNEKSTEEIKKDDKGINTIQENPVIIENPVVKKQFDPQSFNIDLGTIIDNIPLD